jgi:hypothetical protein
MKKTNINNINDKVDFNKNPLTKDELIILEKQYLLSRNKDYKFRLKDIEKKIKYSIFVKFSSALFFVLTTLININNFNGLYFSIGGIFFYFFIDFIVDILIEKRDQGLNIYINKLYPLDCFHEATVEELAELDNITNNKYKVYIAKIYSSGRTILTFEYNMIILKSENIN